jgi:hypothetical protein
VKGLTLEDNIKRDNSTNRVCGRGLNLNAIKVAEFLDYLSDY